MSSELNKSDASADRYTVPALERGLLILTQFSRDQRTLGAPELARRLDLPRSTVFRLLSTLEGMGYVERTENGRDYRLSVGVLRLGFEYVASLDVTELGRPVMERLCEQVRLPCNLVVRDLRSIVYVSRIAAPTPFASSVTVGTRLPAHATVLGHVLLSQLSLTELKELYPEPELERFTSHTPADVPQLYEFCQAIRAQGYALSEGYFESTISTIAAPVFNGAGKVAAALGVTAMAASFEGERLAEMIAQVKAAAAELSELVRHSPHS